jgi:hypothetical protein
LRLRAFVPGGWGARAAPQAKSSQNLKSLFICKCLKINKQIVKIIKIIVHTILSIVNHSPCWQSHYGRNVLLSAAVPGPPEAPAISDILSTSCMVTYQPPTNDGGSPVTGYHVERQTTGGRWLRVNKELIPELKFNMTDLLEGNDYQLRVAAENKVGIGEFSQTSPPFTAKNPWDKPGKPGRPVATEVIGASVRLDWKAPESDGGAEIFNYIVEFRVEGTTKWMRYGTEQETIPIAGHMLSKQLKEDTFYEFRVAAQNKAGVGPYSDISERAKTLIGQ